MRQQSVSIKSSTSCPLLLGAALLVYPTGTETELLLQVGDAQLTLVMHGCTAAWPDDTVYLNIQAAHAHVFDQASGRRLS